MAEPRPLGSYTHFDPRNTFTRKQSGSRRILLEVVGLSAEDGLRGVCLLPLPRDAIYHDAFDGNMIVFDVDFDGPNLEKATVNAMRADFVAGSDNLVRRSVGGELE